MVKVATFNDGSLLVTCHKNIHKLARLPCSPIHWRGLSRLNDANTIWRLAVAEHTGAINDDHVRVMKPLDDIPITRYLAATVTALRVGSGSESAAARAIRQRWSNLVEHFARGVSIHPFSIHLA
jgi:hypothetical protein